ncbi:unnamed protein product, partial [Mesorhabditis belari]|uniref:Uncharacterized protein n=1 Tax=Mesorhabditis belari TaxID=2138241 RepID=A0AAF3EKN6_9BILA
MLLISLFCFVNSFDRLNAQLDFTKYGIGEDYSLFMNNMTNLNDELFNKRNYNRFLSPIFLKDYRTANDSKPLEVHFQLWYFKMFYLDADTQQLTFGAEFIEITINIHQLRFLFSKTLTTIHDSSIRQVTIRSDGIVTMPTVYYVEIACPITVDTFPFDVQACQIPILSFLYSPDDILTNGTVAPAALSLDGGNGEWNVTHITTTTTSFAATMQVFYFIIHLKRVPNFYVYVIALPCFILTMLSVIGMFWSPNIRKEQLTKLSIGLTSLVSMTVLLDLLSTAIPKTRVFPLLGIYVVVCVGIISAACVVIVMFALQNPRKKNDWELKKEAHERAMEGYSPSEFPSWKRIPGIHHL